jgi:hypothetical protein
VSSGHFLVAGNRVCQRTDGAIVAGPRGLVLLAGPRACPGILAEVGKMPVQIGSARVGSIRHMSCPAGRYGLGRGSPAAQRRAGRVQDGSGVVRRSWTELDLMGHDPKAASR